MTCRKNTFNSNIHYNFFPAIEAFNFNTELAVAEILMVTGFFFICGLDVALQKLLGPHMHGHNEQQQENEQTEMKVVAVNGNIANPNVKEVTSEGVEEKMTSALRTFFVVLALSFHAVMDGMALSLLEDVSSVWITFGAISLHKGGLRRGVNTKWFYMLNTNMILH